MTSIDGGVPSSDGVLPRPSWPFALFPQHRTPLELLTTAQVNPPPAAIKVAARDGNVMVVMVVDVKRIVGVVVGLVGLDDEELDGNTMSLMGGLTSWVIFPPIPSSP